MSIVCFVFHILDHLLSNFRSRSTVRFGTPFAYTSWGINKTTLKDNASNTDRFIFFQLLQSKKPEAA